MQSISLKRNYIFKLTYQVLSIILPLITAPYISRVLGAEGVGRYSYASSIMTYFTMFASLGTITYGTKEIAQSRDDKQQMSNVFWGIELMTVGTTLAAGAGWLILCYLSSEYRDLFLALTPTLLAAAADISWLYTGLEKVHYTVTINMICKVAGACAVFAFVKDRGDLLLYVLIMSMSTCLGNLSMWLFLPRMITRLQIRMLKIGRHFRESLKYFIASVAISIYTVLDKTMIGLITHNAAENGYYEQANKVVNTIRPFAFTAINEIMAPRMSYLFAKDQKEEITQRINFSLNVELMLSVGSCFGLIAVAKIFVPLYFGAGFEPAIELLQLMAPLLIIISISNCIGTHYFVPCGKIASCTRYNCIGAIVNLIINIPLIMMFGAKGAVIASLMSETVITILYVTFSKKDIKYIRIWHLLYKKLLSGILMLICCLWVEKIFDYNDFMIMIIEILLGAGVYVISLIILKDDSVSVIMRKSKVLLSHKK